MRRLMWLPVVCCVLVWLLIVPWLPCGYDGTETKLRVRKPIVPPLRPDVELPKAA